MVGLKIGYKAAPPRTPPASQTSARNGDCARYSVALGDIEPRRGGCRV